MMTTSDNNGVLRIAETDANHEVLVNQEMLVVEVCKPLGVRVVLGMVDSNKEEEEKWILLLG